MKDGFRARMGVLHTWAGLVLSALLFAIFWTGTLSVFDEEIDRWMMPVTRIGVDAAAPPLSVDRDIVPLLTERARGAAAWSILLPSERTPYLTLGYDTEASHIPVRDRFHPVTLEPLAASNTRGASRFIYPFHHNLTLRQNNVGAWVVGIASMGMLCLLISGVVIHRKLFAEFFTLRLLRRFGRANLDVHNLTGVLLLPFTLVITLSGLVIAHLIYFPQAPDAVYGNAAAQSAADTRTRPMAERAAPGREERGAPRAEERRAQGRPERSQNTGRRQFMAEAQGRLAPPAIGRAAGVASIDRMIDAAEREWGPGTVYMVRINQPGDAGGVAALRLSNDDSVTQRLDNRRFSLATGEPLKSFQPSAAVNVWSFIGGMHYIQFSHWLLRWLYFLGGLGACAMIATGLLHWTQARNKSSRGSRINVASMNILNIASVAGILGATGAFLLANRVLDNREQLAGIASRDVEVYAFFGVWLLSLLHASFRVLSASRRCSRPPEGARERVGGDFHLRAWAEQCWAIASLAVAAVGMNWITTGDHLVKTVFTDTYWPVAAVDLSLLTMAGVAVWAARKLVRREHGDERSNAARPATQVRHV
ncbi:PepSY domain-containing protein [Verticiella sediminum]|uniref:PepSY domain-containing protein n=1 Tax=Verticiella sediminum TaxID=1247510 RepID=A0A556B252_9BURK|nr:PepSY-associated TM helix domain-containing protein [Verticiella sediminum]TSH99267.1 PepSY domain-containing protein [Verticiella sediminum]